jgi:hypothetical protein
MMKPPFPLFPTRRTAQPPRCRRAADALFRLLPILGALLAAGCLEFEQRIELRADGSAQIALNYAVDEGLAPAHAAAAASIGEWRGGAGGTRPRPPWQLSEADARRHFSGDGMELERFATRTRNGRLRAEILCRATNARAALASGRAGVFDLAPAGDGNWRLRAVLPETPERPPLDDRRTEEIQALCRGLVLRLQVTVPTRIVAAPGATIDGKTATWVFDAAADPAFIRTPPRIEVVFSGSGLDWTAAPAPAP